MDKQELLARFPFPRVIDNTMYEEWKTCPHKFFRGTVQGLRLSEMGEPGTTPTQHKSIHLHFGACIAKGLEVTRKEYFEGAGHNEAVACGGAGKVMAAWDAEGAIPAPRTRTEEAKTLDNCLLAHAGYFREWDLDDPMQQIMVVDGKPLVELSGARPIPGSKHPLTGEPILYAGRFDCTVLDRLGQPIGLDDKTTGGSVETDSWQQQWTLRGQFTGYTWLANGWGYPMEQFLIHGIQVLKTKMHYAECLEVRPWWQVERWLAQLQADLRTMTDQYAIFVGNAPQPYNPTALEGPHPFGQRFGDACHHFNTQCQYARLCQEPNPDDFLDHYVVSRWDPLRVSVD